MFTNYSSEQFQRILGVVSLITSIPLGDINTTVGTILKAVALIMFLWGYVQRFRKGDVNLLGARIIK